MSTVRTCARSDRLCACALDSTRTMATIKAAGESGAVQTVYECKRCKSCYDSLYGVVSHIRAAHSGLELTCGINECTKVSFSTSTWYQHVRSAHSEDYYPKPSAQIHSSSSSRFEPDSTSSPMEITDNDLTEAQVVEGAFTNLIYASPTQCTSTNVELVCY